MIGAGRTALLGLLMALAAGLFDAEPLWVAGLALLGLAAGTSLWVRWAARGASIRREILQTTVVEDEPLPVRISVRAGLLPLPGGAVEESLLSAPAPITPGRRTLAIRVEARFARRGRRVLVPPRLVVRDPLGLAQRVIAASDQLVTVLVLPKTSPVRAPAGWGASMAGRSRAQMGAAAAIEIDGLREHQRGSPASRIHWPSVARGGEMMEKHLRPEMDSRPLIVLDSRGPASAEALDAAVRAAASLCVHLARAGGCALLLPGERRPAAIESDLAAWHPAHVRLALVEAGGMPMASAALGRSGPVLYVAARLPRGMPRPLREASGGRVLVVPVSLPGLPATFEVAGCRGYVLNRESRLAGVA